MILTDASANMELYLDQELDFDLSKNVIMIQEDDNVNNVNKETTLMVKNLREISMTSTNNVKHQAYGDDEYDSYSDYSANTSINEKKDYGRKDYQEKDYDSSCPKVCSVSGATLSW